MQYQHPLLSDQNYLQDCLNSVQWAECPPAFVWLFLIHYLAAYSIQSYMVVTFCPLFLAQYNCLSLHVYFCGILFWTRYFNDVTDSAELGRLDAGEAYRVRSQDGRVQFSARVRVFRLQAS